MSRRAAWLSTVALWTALAAPFAWRFRGAAPDDVFITYRYAQNLAAGRGFAFNPGERVFGLTDPGLGAALGLAHALTRAPIPLLGTLATAAALVALAALLFAGAARRGHAAAATAAGALVVTSGYLWAGQGSGPVVALALLLLAATLADGRERMQKTAGEGRGGDLAAGLVAGLAIACRPDAALGAGLLGLLLLGERRRLPWRYALGLAAVVALALLAAHAAFGTVVPATLLAKRQMAALAAPGRLAAAALFWRRAAAVVAFYAGPLSIPLLVLGAAGQAALLRGAAGRAGRLLALTAAGTALAYTVLGVPFFTWYLAPVVAALLAGAAFVAGWLCRLRPPAARLAGAAAAVLVLASPLAASWSVLRAGPAGDWRATAYTAAGRWLRRHSRPEERIALEEIGIVAFTADRPVLDLIGLVSPSSLPYAAVSDPLGAFLTAPTDLVLFHTFNYRGATRPIVERPWFPAAYSLAARLDFPALGGSVFLYRRRPGASVPPPRPPFSPPASAPARSRPAAT